MNKNCFDTAMHISVDNAIKCMCDVDNRDKTIAIMMQTITTASAVLGALAEGYEVDEALAMGCTHITPVNEEEPEVDKWEGTPFTE